MTTKINDLRSALDYLRTIPGQLVETNVEADPRAEISGIYRYVGAKGTVKRPTRLGPAMIFNNVKGHPGAKVLSAYFQAVPVSGTCWDVNPKSWDFF